MHFENRTDPDGGAGLDGRADPNNVIDTKFYSQNEDANQTLTGVTKVESTANGAVSTNQNIDGSEEVVRNDEIPVLQPVTNVRL